MKTKLLALIMAILCFVTVFAACGKKCEEHVDEDGDAVCDNCGEVIVDESKPENTEDTCNHVDVDANKVCDNCGKAIVAIVEQLPAETEPIVDMIVNQIPTDVDISKYMNVAIPKAEKVNGSEKKVEGLISMVGDVVLCKTETDGVKTLTVTDLKNNKVLITKTDVVSATSTTRYTITFGDAWYVVETEKQEALNGNTYLSLVSRTYDVFTYSGEQIGETFLYDGQLNFISFEAPSLDTSIYDYNIDYVIFGDKTYAISDKTGEIIYSCQTDVLVKRPVMDYIIGDYGYVVEENYEEDESINVYDLKEWIKCVYTYDVPEDVENALIEVINGGDIFVTYCNPLSNGAVNYDFIQSGKKYDIVYTVIDAESFEEKNIEFGYYVYSMRGIDEYAVATEEAMAYNIVQVSKIVSGRIEGELCSFIVDNELNIICDISSLNDTELVGDGILAREVKFNYGDYAYELVKMDGTLIDYVPYDSDFAYGYRINENRIFDLSGKLVLDLTEASIHGHGISDFYDYGFVIYSERVVVENEGTKTVYKIFNGGNNLEINTNKTTWVLLETYRNGYVVTYRENDVDVYEFFNVEGESILKTNSYLYVGSEYIKTYNEVYVIK